MSVVGFDIGNENCVIAAARVRGIDILLNDESNRENPAVVSFGEKQRFIGSAGAASATMHPKSTVCQVKRLIGRNFNEPIVQDDLRLLPFETSEGLDGGILIHLQYLREKRTFTPIQILAMLLGHLNQIAEKNLESQITSCVIGIPAYFSACQRHAYLHAADIAGLKPLRLIHDCTAIALGYGIYKTDFSNRVPTNVVFIDVGHSDMQVAVVSYNPGRMKVLSHAFDSNLGGRDFDEVLFKHFATLFREQYNIDVYSSAKASIRLRAACEKLKKVLSANPEAPLNIECLMEEKDVKGFIKREEFEKLSSSLLERLVVPCRKALLDSGLPVEKIYSVELVGSGSRIPAITKIVSSLFRKEPSRKLNASECVALGCAVQSAMLSPTFRVREYEVQDCLPFSTAFATDEGTVCSSTDGVLFPRGSAFPNTKMLMLYRNDLFQMESFYANKNELPPGMSTKISSFKMGPLRVPNAEKMKIKVKVQINLHGIVTIDSATLLDDHGDDSAVNNSDDTISESLERSSSKSNGLNHEMKRLKAIRRQDIFIDEVKYGGMTQGDLSQAKEKELQMTQRDIIMERTKDKKNALEAYVYETRNKLFNSYRSFATDSEKDGISSKLQQTEEWLYEDGDDETEHVYVQQLENLKKMLDPIEIRCKDVEARTVETRNLQNLLTQYRKEAESLSLGERDAVIEECDKAVHWLQEKIQYQESLPKNVDPIIWSSEIKRKAEALDEMFWNAMGSKFSGPQPKTANESEKDDMEVD